MEVLLYVVVVAREDPVSGALSTFYGMSQQGHPGPISVTRLGSGMIRTSTGRQYFLFLCNKIDGIYFRLLWIDIIKHSLMYSVE